jgi:hypothetical protein
VAGFTAERPRPRRVAYANLALQDGAIKFAGENRTLYVGLNRVIDPATDQNTYRNGCGVRHAIIWTE